MNAARRKEIDRAIALLKEAKEILDGVGDDEQDAHDNLPESMQDGDQGASMQDAADAIFMLIQDIDEVIEGAADAKGQ